MWMGDNDGVMFAGITGNNLTLIPLKLTFPHFFKKSERKWDTELTHSVKYSERKWALVDCYLGTSEF